MNEGQDFLLFSNIKKKKKKEYILFTERMIVLL